MHIKKRIKGILVLSILLINFFLITFPNNVNINQNIKGNENKYNNNEDLKHENLKTEDVAFDNTFTGTGAPWDVTHYANYTKSNLAVSFNNNSFDDTHAKVELYGWNGYQLNSTIKDLYDTRNWINGTFHAGSFVGGSPAGSNDSDYIDGWTFKTGDVQGYTNPMSGNYFDGSTSISDYEDCLELRVDDYSTGYYDVGDRCWWETNIQLDRGDVDKAWLSFAVFPKYSDGYNNHWVLQVIINGKLIWGNGLQSMIDASGNSNGQWYNPYPIYLDGNDEQIFPTGVKDLNITLEFKRVSGTAPGGYAGYYTVLFDNVSLIVKSKAKPSQLQLQLNGENVHDKANYGEGNLGIIGNWDGSLQSSVIANFSSDANWPYTYQDDGNWNSYKVEFSTNLNLYTTKSTPESYYRADPDLSYQGSSFIVSNNSNVNWTTYAHMEIPTGYEETNMTVEYPSDFDLTGVYFSLNPNSLSETFIKKIGNKKVVNVPVSSITSNTNGFWRFVAVSPNYCLEMDMYSNITGNWELKSSFFSGEYINITARINNTQLISGYIQQTKAQLQIKFPNGTIWTRENQLKQVNNVGMVYFDPIMIPSDKPNYEVGNYNAIITWNNSYSSFNLNETGIIYKSFTVNHNSSLVPDEFYYPDIFEGETVNLKVSFYDLRNNKPIEDANIYLINFTEGIQYFNEINPGYYLLIFNTTGGNPGDNDLTIYGSHPSYQNNKVNITIEVIAYTKLTAEEYPNIEVPWNNNFTIHLNYTVRSDNSGIENANPTVYWNDEISIKSGNGLYNITCSTSKYQVNTAPNLRIEFNEIGYESQTMIISIEIVERETYIDNIFINDADCSINKSYNVHAGDILNITIKYKDNDAGGSFIHDAIVTLNGTSIGEIFTDNNNFYNLTLNTSKLSIGIIFLNIIAQKKNYTSVTELLTINVFERETDYWLYLNGLIQGKNPSIKLYRDQFLNITLTYNDTTLKEHISGAIVDINGSGISELLNEAYNNYSVLIDTNDLNQGVNFLTIFARKSGYEAHSILLVIEIIQIETDLTLFIDGAEQPLNPSITRYPNEIINATVSYDTSIPVSHISGATVDINGSGVSELLTEAYNNYSVLIDTNDLNQGANFLTIFARKSGYEPQTILLVIEIIQLETDLTLFIDGAEQPLNPSITRYPNEIINVTASYDTSIPVSHISGAIVDINGSGVSELLTEAYNNYSVLINTIDLNQGVNFLTIFARKSGYEPHSILLIIQIVQIKTDIQIFLNDYNKTLDPVFNLTIGQDLNLTIKYTDQTGAFIPNATITLIGEGKLWQLGKDSTFQQYYIILNTTELGTGGKLFSIIAQKSNFEAITKDLYITINRIAAQISTLSGETQIEAEIGDNVLLQIILNDPIFSANITGATVTYKWAYGQGELFDSDNNGIFEVVLYNVPEGVHTITINAIAGEEYDFKSYQITLIVMPSGGIADLTWLIYILGGGIVGMVTIFTLYQKHFKYPPMVRKIRKLRKKVRKEKKLKKVLLNEREAIVNDQIQDKLQILDLEKNIGKMMKDA
ncbi:MAG: hypothetical protein ACFE9P_12135 [Candidatus Hermodarchaeota archaeon]